MKLTQGKIINAAAAVLKKNGASFSMRKVAEEAAISLGNLQYHYKTKNDLLSALLTHYADLYEKDMQLWLYKNTTAEKQTVSLALKTILEDLESDDSDIIELVFISLYGLDEQSDKILGDFYSRIYNLLFQFITSIKPEAEQNKIHLAASMIMPYVESYKAVKKHLGASSDDIVYTLTDMIFRVLAKE